MSIVTLILIFCTLMSCWEDVFTSPVSEYQKTNNFSNSIWQDIRICSVLNSIRCMILVPMQITTSWIFSYYSISLLERLDIVRDQQLQHLHTSGESNIASGQIGYYQGFHKQWLRQGKQYTVRTFLRVILWICHSSTCLFCCFCH